MAPARLADEGWTRRSVASEPRLSEIVELYESLGLEVLLVPVLRDREETGAEGICAACFGSGEEADRTRAVYTRPRAPQEDGR